jgi:hypothetical protein
LTLGEGLGSGFLLRGFAVITAKPNKATPVMESTTKTPFTGIFPVGMSSRRTIGLEVWSGAARLASAAGLGLVGSCLKKLESIWQRLLLCLSGEVKLCLADG